MKGDALSRFDGGAGPEEDVGDDQAAGEAALPREGLSFEVVRLLCFGLLRLPGGGSTSSIATFLVLSDAVFATVGLFSPKLKLSPSLATDSQHHPYYQNA